MPDIYHNFLAGVLSADPGTAGTVLNSGNFAFMPVVAAPNTMRISLDPEGTVGVPEIAVVTAHVAFALTCTVIRGQETGFGAGPARAHATDTVWRHSLTRASIAEMIADVTIPAAAVSATLAATPDPGHLFLDGTTVINAQTLYPATWARIPASMKSGSSMLLPDARGATLMMDDAAALLTLGAMSGANALTLLMANLPASGLTIDPPSTLVSIDPPDTLTDGGADHPSHTHLASGVGSAPSNGWLVGEKAGGPFGIDLLPATGLAVDRVFTRDAVGTGGPSPAIPAHHVNIPAFNATVDIAPFASPNLGSGTPINTTPRNLCINWQIKVH